VKSQRLLRAEAARIWTAALRAVDPDAAVRSFVQRRGQVLQVQGSRLNLGNFRKTWVLGAGKAAAPMGRALETILGKHLAGGLLVTKYGHSLPLKRIEIAESGHPLPDRNSVVAAARILSFAQTQISSDDLVLCVFSGGASSLVASPAEGVTWEDKAACTALLLKAGSSIHELNVVRKHLSSFKGGGLARVLAPAHVLSLLLSDVVGDDPGTIASGPTSPDPSTFADCLEILNKYRLSEQVPLSVEKRISVGAAGGVTETPKHGDPAFANGRIVVIGSCAQACAAASRAARRLGYRAMVLTSRLEGDNEAAARFHMSIGSEVVFHQRPVRRPACIISGGETTVKVTGAGIGGRNQEFALHCSRELARLPAPCVVVSLGTDGTDGPTDAAGAIADSTTLARSTKYGARFLDDCLENNDSYMFFKRLGDLIITGPTRTNVMDLHLLLIG
jgi:glycerate 2-kinase